MDHYQRGIIDRQQSFVHFIVCFFLSLYVSFTNRRVDYEVRKSLNLLNSRNEQIFLFFFFIFNHRLVSLSHKYIDYNNSVIFQLDYLNSTFYARNSTFFISYKMQIGTKYSKIK